MKTLAEQIIELVGGEENIQSLTHCVTRLRFNLKDERQAQTKRIDELEGVMGVQQKGGQYQVIVGGKVGKLYNEIVKLLPALSDTTTEESGKEHESLMNRLINIISAILVPSLAPVVGGGMLKGFLFMLTTFGWLNAEGDTAFVLTMMSDAMFYFFPFLLAVSSARKFRTNEYMALSLAGVLMYPTLIAAAQAGDITSIKFLGFLPILVVNYSSSIIPIILAVWLLSHVYRFFENHVPEIITVIFTPLLTLLIVVPLMLFALAPIGFYAGEYVASGIEKLINFSPIISGFVIGASRPILVLMGMHHALRPLTQQQIASYGFSTMSAMNFMSTMAQATAAFAIYFVVRDRKMKQVAMSSTVSGYLGITEPALYGVLIKYKAALIGASLGGGIGSSIGAVMGAKAMAMVMPSILSVPVYLNDTAAGFVIGAITAVLSTFVITFVLAKTVFKIEEASTEGPVSAAAKQEDVYTVAAPVAGKTYPISDVADVTFAKELLGKGTAILPSGNDIVSPVNGTVTVTFKTGHAIGLLSEEGMELLIHVGLDTVELNGEGFTMLCKEGDNVKVGTPLLQFDRALLEEREYDTSVVVVVTNTADYLFVAGEEQQREVQAGMTVISVIPEKSTLPAAAVPSS